ncbi:hypothetical protein [Vibrio tritonius]|uniref:hypothetical protein n=1 Tax=Vibrio tritonius TaxID=1435069 RepID=UPI00315DA549
MIRHIKPTHADIDAQLALLKPAFEGSPTPKSEFLDMCDRVKTQNASFYQLSHSGGSVRFVGLVEGNDYLIYALSGKNLRQAAPAIIERVKQCGYQAIKFHTYKNGMRRILNVFGFHEVERMQCESGAVETVHALTL